MLAGHDPRRRRTAACSRPGDELVQVARHRARPRLRGHRGLHLRGTCDERHRDRGSTGPTRQAARGLSRESSRDPRDLCLDRCPGGPPIARARVYDGRMSSDDGMRVVGTIRSIELHTLAAKFQNVTPRQVAKIQLDIERATDEEGEELDVVNLADLHFQGPAELVPRFSRRRSRPDRDERRVEPAHHEHPPGAAVLRRPAIAPRARDADGGDRRRARSARRAGRSRSARCSGGTRLTRCASSREPRGRADADARRERESPRRASHRGHSDAATATHAASAPGFGSVSSEPVASPRAALDASPAGPARRGAAATRRRRSRRSARAAAIASQRTSSRPRRHDAPDADERERRVHRVRDRAAEADADREPRGARRPPRRRSRR